MSKYKISQSLEAVMKKVMPIPRRPRTYRLSSPHKPVHWIPSGSFENPKYRKELLKFAEIMKHYDAQREGSILEKLTSRGWCYVLEGLGRLEKGSGFKRCADAINDCRKLGYLPIDFTAPDQDLTRSFTEVHEIRGIASPLQEFKDDLDTLLERTLPHVTTDYWDGEEYYLMMVVEKIDIRNLFKPLCKLFTLPLLNSSGWYSIESRAKIIKACKAAEDRGITPVLLLFYDYDITGLKITEKFRKGLNDLEGATNWRADNIIVERFGLNHKEITEHNLMWIGNLKSGTGRDPDWERKDVKNYIANLAELERERLGIPDTEWLHYPQTRKDAFGIKKCEANALVRDKQTIDLGLLLCYRTIVKYYGEGALERFKEKREKAKENFRDVYENEAFEKFGKSLDELIEKYSEPPEKLPEGTIGTLEKAHEVEIDNQYYSSCPKCHQSFNYDKTFIDRYVRCRHCRDLMLLKKADSWEL